MEQELSVLLQEHYVIISCEGTAEEEIIKWLDEEQKLIFAPGDIVDDGITRLRQARQIETNFLNKDYQRQLSILRVHDSRRENFKLGRVYRERFQVYELYTHPEIEMLVICHEGRYDEWRRSRLSPSEYCRQNLRLDTKPQGFVRSYFGNTDELIASIKEYHRVECRRGEYCIWDILVRSLR